MTNRDVTNTDKSNAAKSRKTLAVRTEKRKMASIDKRGRPKICDI